MTADILREAAAKMREQAKAATPGPWHVGEDADSGERFVYDTGWRELAQVNEWSTGIGNPQHIASWHPAVALAVADWLDSASSMGDQTGEPIFDAALAVARSFLGRDA